ncbi:MAG: hypothetical protein ACO3GP_08840 [Candidatus Limnocylindrus sp.]
MELLAAVASAAITVSAMALGAFSKRGNDIRESVIKVTLGLDHIRSEISLLRNELHTDRADLYARLNQVEQRVSAMEGRG